MISETMVTATAIPIWPTPAATPMAATTHSPPAVVSPLTTTPSRKITPAPMNPIPAATCEAMRERSVPGPANPATPT